MLNNPQIIGLISCTGTNFLLRAEAWRNVGGFPAYTLVEDFALGLELTLKGTEVLPFMECL